MILGVGIDIVANHRIARLYERYGNRFLQYSFTSMEQEVACKEKINPTLPLALFFAAKEACVKAIHLPYYRESIKMRDIEISGNLQIVRRLDQIILNTQDIHKKEDFRDISMRVAADQNDQYSVAFAICLRNQ